MEPVPGRHCPAAFGLRARDLAAAEPLAATTVLVAGGLYGNRHALAALQARAAAEDGAELILAGDLHWFDAEPEAFARLEEAARRHRAVAGNVELMLADPAGGDDCGCAYPGHVDAATVARSNAIMARLHRAAGAVPGARQRLAALPRWLVLAVGGLRIAVVHGDLRSVAGWDFALEHLAPPGNAVRARLGARRHTTAETVRALCREADVAAVACAHTCLPCLARADGVVVINNGAAGMPCFRGRREGVATRISAAGPAADALYGVELGGVRLEAVPVPYDHGAWLAEFDALWPAGSAAAEGYRARLVAGPPLAPAEAVLALAGTAA
ncbi:metallophosphoesterase family protein [Inmirania thermothiophila]|uniref:Calcineurin-like phosphoesterase family protein n=1 Tax=Inmirania thermothiophila TaxID=1750597 RepID=A0A3N1YAC1_9GAMM|nr:metallophosphoesterase family protein [Inmirania thermothiophila]ROR34347.1 calcineurin-like phosphoesterase family protein [Inmirania thermothiophila]